VARWLVELLLLALYQAIVILAGIWLTFLLVYLLASFRQH